MGNIWDRMFLPYQDSSQKEINSQKNPLSNHVSCFLFAKYVHCSVGGGMGSPWARIPALFKVAVSGNPK